MPTTVRYLPFGVGKNTVRFALLTFHAGSPLTDFIYRPTTFATRPPTHTPAPHACLCATFRCSHWFMVLLPGYSYHCRYCIPPRCYTAVAGWLVNTHNCPTPQRFICYPTPDAGSPDYHADASAPLAAGLVPLVLSARCWCGDIPWLNYAKHVPRFQFHPLHIATASIDAFRLCGLFFITSTTPLVTCCGHFRYRVWFPTPTLTPSTYTHPAATHLPPFLPARCQASGCVWFMPHDAILPHCLLRKITCPG